MPTGPSPVRIPNPQAYEMASYCLPTRGKSCCPVCGDDRCARIQPEILAYHRIGFPTLFGLFARLIELEVPAGVNTHLRDETKAGPKWSRAWVKRETAEFSDFGTRGVVYRVIRMRGATYGVGFLARPVPDELLQKLLAAATQCAARSASCSRRASLLCAIQTFAERSMTSLNGLMCRLLQAIAANSGISTQG